MKITQLNNLGKSENSESCEFFSGIGSAKGSTDEAEKGDTRKSNEEATIEENSGGANDEFGKSAKRVTSDYEDAT